MEVTEAAIGMAMEVTENDARIGLRPLVSGDYQLIFIIFAFSFSKPRTKRDWRSFGAFSAFIVALFVEMYGFPLTIYLISGWVLKRYPNLDLFSHDAGHLWNTLLGWDINPHFDPLHILSNVLIFGGFILLSAAWKVLYEAQKERTLATTGPYAYVRHPQYVGFILIILGFLFQWAYADHVGDVSNPGNYVRQTCSTRRARSAGRVRGRLSALYVPDAGVYSSVRGYTKQPESLTRGSVVLGRSDMRAA